VHVLNIRMLGNAILQLCGFQTIRIVIWEHDKRADKFSSVCVFITHELTDDLFFSRFMLMRQFVFCCLVFCCYFMRSLDAINNLV
jgi:hypothetical protein